MGGPPGGGAARRGRPVRLGGGGDTAPRSGGRNWRRRAEAALLTAFTIELEEAHAHPTPLPRALGISGRALRHIRAAEMPVRRAGGGGGLGAPPRLAALCGARGLSGPGSGGGRPGPPHRRRPPLTATGRPPRWGRGGAPAPRGGGARPRPGLGAPLCPVTPGSPSPPSPARARAGVRQAAPRALPAEAWAAGPGSSGSRRRGSLGARPTGCGLKGGSGRTSGSIPQPRLARVGLSYSAFTVLITLCLRGRT